MASNQSSITYAIASKIESNINILPDIRNEIAGILGTMPSDEEVVVTAVDIRSASKFSVAFNSYTYIDATLVGSEYVVQFEGVILYLYFIGEATLTSMWCEWDKGHKDHKVPTFIYEEDTDLYILDGYEIGYLPATSTGGFELSAGTYIAEILNGAEGDKRIKFKYNLEDTVILE